MAEPIHQTVRESVEKTRENAVVNNNFEIKSAKVKTLVQNSAAPTKNMEKKDQINDKQDLISKESKIVTQDEPIIVVNQVEEKNSNSTSHCWSSGKKR